MSVEVYCSNQSCKRRYTVPVATAGKSVKCTACGETFIAGRSTVGETSAVDQPFETLDDPQEVRVVVSGEPISVSATPRTSKTSFGRFVIREKKGTGAFGTVYRAYDPQLDREVALKVPHPGVMTDDKRVERFLREAKAAANLHHPHIVTVFDAGKDGDNYYIASAFIDGKTLSATIPDGGTEFARAARLVRELAEALAYAHEQGIVHRDVKPANMMLDVHDHVHLMDFGLAVRQEEEARLTNDGAVMGTAAYMSPEQARGQASDPQPTTDQYAAGVVLYELLTGTVPFKGPTSVVVHNVIYVEPEPPRKHRASAPRDLETICLRALSKNPDNRYADCQALADDLRRWLEGEPITARRMNLPERAVRWVKKEPKLAGAAALIGLVLVLSFVLVSSSAERADAAAEQARKDAQDARTAEKKAEDALAETHAARAREERAAGEALGALGTAEEERRKAAALQSTVVKLQAQIRQSVTDPVDFRAHAGSVLSASFSPNDVRVATGGEDNVARVWNAKTGTEVFTLRGHTGAVRSVSFSADDSWIVTGGDDNMARVWNAKTGTEVLTLRGHTGAVHSTSFSADGFWIATASGDGTAKVWDAKTGAAVLVLRGHTDAVLSVSFSVDGSWIATASRDGTARVWHAKKGTEILPLKHTGVVFSVSFNADGTRVVTGSEDGTARVWDTKTGAEVLALNGHANRVTSASFSADGLRVVTGSRDKTARVWDAKTGTELFVLKGHTGNVEAASFNADGTRVITASDDKTAKVWSAVISSLLPK